MFCVVIWIVYSWCPVVRWLINVVWCDVMSERFIDMIVELLTENWRRPPGWPGSTRLKNVTDDMTSSDIALQVARDAAWNWSFSRLLALHDAMHALWLGMNGYLLRIWPDFHYRTKSVSGRIAYFMPDRIFTVCQYSLSIVWVMLCWSQLVIDLDLSVPWSVGCAR